MVERSNRAASCAAAACSGTAAKKADAGVVGIASARLFRRTWPIKRGFDELQTICPGEASYPAYNAVIEVNWGFLGLGSDVELRAEDLQAMA